jgi:hypothetical protein
MNEFRNKGGDIMNIDLWDSGMERIYLPVVCPNCEMKVSVRGEIKDGIVQLEHCPECGYGQMELTLAANDPKRPDEIIVTVRWEMSNKQTVEHKMPFTDLIEAICFPIDLGCFIFSNESITPMENRALVVHKLMSDFEVKELINFRELLDDLINQKG